MRDFNTFISYNFNTKISDDNKVIFYLSILSGCMIGLSLITLPAYTILNLFFEDVSFLSSMISTIVILLLIASHRFIDADEISSKIQLETKTIKTKIKEFFNSVL